MIVMRQMEGRVSVKLVAATGWQDHEEFSVADSCRPMLAERKKERR
jgi:hypothetical protein